MAEKSEDSSRAENKFKMSLLQIEKRVIDLETTINELNEKIDKPSVSGADQLNQKVEDLEDLVMVEQAGINELKKILEGIVPKTEETSDLVSKPELQSELEDIKKQMASISTKLTSDEMEPLNKKIETIESELEMLKSYAENSTKKLHEKITELVSESKPTVNYDFLKSKIESLESGIDNMTKKKMDLDLKLNELDKRFDSLETKMKYSLSGKFVDELKIVKKTIEETREEVDRRIGELARGVVAPQDLKSRVDILNAKMNEIQRMPVSSLSPDQVNEIFDKLVFLESKLAAVERITVQRSKNVPLILE